MNTGVNTGGVQISRWQTFADPLELQRAATRIVLESAQQAITERGAFRCVLAGGNTPRVLYRSLRTAVADWRAWIIYFGDERCAPAADPSRNSRMASDEWLDHVAIPCRQIYAIPAELGPEPAAASYANTLAGVGTFDLVILGLGEDGHTASLFPGATWEGSTTWPAAIPVHDAPKPPPERVSLSPARLSDALKVVYLVVGADKRDAVAAWRAGAALPASRICPPAGVDILLHL
ncbi:6-phosphogluconolactonase [uncultured Thiodictyon sp.]|uniref:6-phosphogluconolactonase n=1 Tax=uncultured Thiodictyon sp. TaxID=1846217 RepID=UPI0025F24FB5|nr:6-phosphogluconolactonase [uncultured Thiodictyon sp.]